MGQAKRGENN